MSESGAPSLGFDWTAFMLLVAQHVDVDSAKAITEVVQRSAWLRDRDASMRLYGAVLGDDAVQDAEAHQLARRVAWEQGYIRGVLDEVRGLERADNPYEAPQNDTPTILDLPPIERDRG